MSGRWKDLTADAKAALYKALVTPEERFKTFEDIFRDYLDYQPTPFVLLSAPQRELTPEVERKFGPWFDVARIYDPFAFRKYGVIPSVLKIEANGEMILPNTLRDHTRPGNCVSSRTTTRVCQRTASGKQGGQTRRCAARFVALCLP